ncbi:hypothetical protein K438DRAFT_1777977 [Mycena galopus ATCC 62051]|nr:hypothetical protein K438DRAFT_1777977 [Mycena galopus ATCC 62051]
MYDDSYNELVRRLYFPSHSKSTDDDGRWAGGPQLVDAKWSRHSIRIRIRGQVDATGKMHRRAFPQRRRHGLEDEVRVDAERQIRAVVDGTGDFEDSEWRSIWEQSEWEFHEVGDHNQHTCAVDDPPRDRGIRSICATLEDKRDIIDVAPLFGAILVDPFECFRQRELIKGESDGEGVTGIRSGEAQGHLLLANPTETLYPVLGPAAQLVHDGSGVFDGQNQQTAPGQRMANGGLVVKEGMKEKGTTKMAGNNRKQSFFQKEVQASSSSFAKKWAHTTTNRRFAALWAHIMIHHGKNYRPERAFQAVRRTVPQRKDKRPFPHNQGDFWPARTAFHKAVQAGTESELWRAVTTAAGRGGGSSVNELERNAEVV